MTLIILIAILTVWGFFSFCTYSSLVLAVSINEFVVPTRTMFYIMLALGPIGFLMAGIHIIYKLSIYNDVSKHG